MCGYHFSTSELVRRLAGYLFRPNSLMLANDFPMEPRLDYRSSNEPMEMQVVE
jgi:hypothetical protein